MATIPAHLAQFAADGSWTNMTIGDYARRWAEADPERQVYLGDPTAPTYASLLADGEALVFHPEAGGARLVGRLKIEDWPGLAGR